jgi:hypothetical protein
MGSSPLMGPSQDGKEGAWRSRIEQAATGNAIATLLRELLQASTLCGIAAITDRGTAHINTAYFAWAEDFRLV